MWRTSETQKRVETTLRDADELIVFDCETTGIKPQKDFIIQISAIKFMADKSEAGIVKFIEKERLNKYIRPYFAIDEEIESLTGITNDFLAHEKDEEEVFPEIFAFFGGSPIVAAYNSKFDTSFLYYLYMRNGKNLENAIITDGKFQGLSTEIDVLKIARDLTDPSKVENFKLQTIAEYYGQSDNAAFHRSDEDTFVTSKLLFLFLEKYQTKGAEDNKEKIPLKFLHAAYWNKYGHKMERIYVTADKVKVYYDIYKKVWACKDSDISNYDMEDLRRQIFSYYHVSSEAELVKVIK